MSILFDPDMYAPAALIDTGTPTDERPTAPEATVPPSDVLLGAWAASLALKGIEKVKTDPRKLYDEVRTLLGEGNLPAAKRKMMLFKKWAEGTSDPKLLKMREEIRTILRELNFAAVEDLKKANETLLEQRLSHLDLITPHFVHEKMAEKNGRALDLLAGLIEKGAVDTIEEGLKIVKPLMADDADLMRLIELETRKGLRDFDTPEKMRKGTLEVAKDLRHRDGSYAVAEEKLKTVLEEEIREAMASITPGEVKSVRDEVHHKIYVYNRVRERAIEALDKLKEEDPEKFKEEYPESSRRGFFYEDELKREMNEIYAVLVEAAKEKFALKKVGEKYEAGKILDPVAREAWLTLDRMKDPTDAWLEMSDATWDRLIDEAVVMAMTGVAAAGAGSVTRFGVSALTRSLTARGGAWALAARGTSFAAVTAAESLAMEGVNYAVTKEFDPKNLAFNALTSFIFHGGPALARGLGFVDEVAVGMAAKAKNLAGTLSVQTLLDTGVGYLHDATIGHGDERTLWERLFQGALRMGGFRAIGVLTSHATIPLEILAKVRDEAARVRSCPKGPEILEYNKHLVDFEANMNEAMARMGALDEVRRGPEAMAAVERALESRIKLLEAQAKLGKEFADPLASESAKAVLAEIRGMKAISKAKIVDVEASEEVVGKGKKPAPKKGKPNHDLIAASEALAAGAVAVFAGQAHAAVAAVESLGHWGPAAALGVGAGVFAVGGIFSWLGRWWRGGPTEGEAPRGPVETRASELPENGHPYREPPPPPARGKVLSYYKDGRHEVIELSSDQTIQGITLPKGSRVRFALYGHLNSADLPSDHTIDGIPCKEGYVSFHLNGQLHSSYLPSEHTIDGIPCEGGTVWFHENGKLSVAKLSSDRTIDGIPCSESLLVSFHENGKLSSANLSSDHTIDGIPFKGGSEVNFRENGKLEGAGFSSDHTIGGIPFKGGSTVKFRENGKLESAYLSSAHTIDGTRYPSETTITLDEDGRVIHARPYESPSGGGSGGGAAAIGLVPFVAGDASPVPEFVHAVTEHFGSATDAVINGGLALVADLAAGSPGSALLVGGAIAGGLGIGAKYLWDAVLGKGKRSEKVASKEAVIDGVIEVGEGDVLSIRDIKKPPTSAEAADEIAFSVASSKVIPLTKKKADSKPAPLAAAAYARSDDAVIPVVKPPVAPTKPTGEAKFIDFEALKDVADRVESVSGVILVDTNFGRKEKYLRVLDHHGVYANEKNSTEQLLDLFEAKLKEAGGDVDRAIELLNIREVATDNLADGGWAVWIAKNQAKVLSDPLLRDLIRRATHFEDFTAFGSKYSLEEYLPDGTANPDYLGIHLQAALFHRYNAILAEYDIKGSDRLPSDKSAKVMGEAVNAIDELVALASGPRREEAILKASKPFWDEIGYPDSTGKVPEGSAIDVARTKARMDDVSVEGEVVFYDTSKMIDPKTRRPYPTFTQWLAVPLAHSENLQVTAAPMGEEAGNAKRLYIVAIPDGRSLPSGKTMLDVLKTINEAEKAKADGLGLKPNSWFGKENVILPNPKGGGSLLTPAELSALLRDPHSLKLFVASPDERTVPAIPKERIMKKARWTVGHEAERKKISLEMAKFAFPFVADMGRTIHWKEGLPSFPLETGVPIRDVVVHQPEFIEGFHLGSIDPSKYGVEIVVGNETYRRELIDYILAKNPGRVERVSDGGKEYLMFLTPEGREFSVRVSTPSGENTVKVSYDAPTVIRPVDARAMDKAALLGPMSAGAMMVFGPGMETVPPALQIALVGLGVLMTIGGKPIWERVKGIFKKKAEPAAGWSGVEAVVVPPPAKGAWLVLNPGEGRVLGREAFSGLEAARTVSRGEHARISRGGDGSWWIEDLGSKFGTWVKRGEGDWDRLAKGRRFPMKLGAEYALGHVLPEAGDADNASRLILKGDGLYLDPELREHKIGGVSVKMKPVKLTGGTASGR